MFDPTVVRVFVMLATAGRETGQIMTKRKRRAPEKIPRKLGQADRMLTDDNDIAAIRRELGVSEQSCYGRRNHMAAQKNGVPHGGATHGGR